MGSRLPLLIAVLCVVLVVAFASRLRPPMPGIDGPHIAPLTPQMRAAHEEWGSREGAARAAKAQGDWAGAETEYRAETLMQHCPFKSEIWVELGLMQDYQGKRDEAFKAYRKGFGIGSHRGPDVGGNMPEIAEAAARCGLMCEDRNLHADACECYYTACRLGGTGRALPMTLDPQRTSPVVVRRLLGIVLHDAQNRDKYTNGPI